MVRMYDHTHIGRSLRPIAGSIFCRAAGSVLPISPGCLLYLFSIPCAPGFRERICVSEPVSIDAKENLDG